MALTADLQRELQGRSKIELQVINSQIIFSPGLLEAAAPDNTTVANRGRVQAFTGGNETIPVGFALEGVTGDTSASPIPRGRIGIERHIREGISVTGVTGLGDVMKPVYATDDNTFTLTKPTPAQIIGVVINFRAGTVVDVLFFAFEDMFLNALNGAGQQTWLLGTIAPAITASGNLLTGIEAPYHGRINSVYGICVRGPTDADVDIDVNIEIGGVNVTGGLVELLFSDVTGDKKAGTAITADGGNIFHQDDLIDIEGLVNTAGTLTDVGLYNLYAEVEPLPGL